ncbi:hypothetical protein [Leucobacter luti]|uniref:hypothetical protein n=1 Tax=Leucobacter luti TaxID=340320 RepID=UPI003D01479A
MSESKQTSEGAAPTADADAVVELHPEAGIGGAAAFADAEAREILNLLGESESGGACCGGSCCV